MRTRLQSALTGLLFGGVLVGIVGAIALGLLAYFDDTPYIIGYARNYIGVYIIFGLVCGFVVGGILGAVIGAIQAQRRTGK